MTRAGGLAAPRRLSLPHRLALAAEVVAVYARVRWLLRGDDVRVAMARLRPAGRDEVNGGDEVTGLRLGKAVTRVLRRLPVEAGCLPTSLVLYRMLARRGVESSVVIGVRARASFGAHAWVELGGRPLLPRMETEFERLVEL